MAITLIVRSGAHQGQRVHLPAQEITLGRDDDCELRLNHEFVSRKHCVLKLTGSNLVVRDLKSQNGTYVNDVAISHTTLLEPGDLLRVGPMVFEVAEVPDPVPAPPVPAAAVPVPSAPAVPRENGTAPAVPNGPAVPNLPVVSSASGRALPRVLEEGAPATSRETGVMREPPRRNQSPGNGGASGVMKSAVFPTVPITSTGNGNGANSLSGATQRNPRPQLNSFTPAELPELVLEPEDDRPSYEIAAEVIYQHHWNRLQREQNGQNQ